MDEEWKLVIAALCKNMERLANAILLQEQQIIQLRADVEHLYAPTSTMIQ